MLASAAKALFQPHSNGFRCCIFFASNRVRHWKDYGRATRIASALMTLIFCNVRASVSVNTKNRSNSNASFGEMHVTSGKLHGYYQ